MPRPSPFEILYDEVVHEHLGAIGNKYISLVRVTIETQLRFEPDVETRNRKPLGAPTTIGTGWELRFGPNNRFRVFYDVHPDERRVIILAIGVKIRNELRIGREVWKV